MSTEEAIRVARFFATTSIATCVAVNVVALYEPSVAVILLTAAAVCTLSLVIHRKLDRGDQS